MEKQNRRVLGYINPDIVPVDQDQWDRLKQEIDSIHPVPESNNNTKWGILGFCGSLIISNIYYALSQSPNLTAVGISVGLIIGLFVASLAFGKAHNKDKAIQKVSVARCKDAIKAIEHRLQKEEAAFISASLENKELYTEVDKNTDSDKLHQNIELDEDFLKTDSKSVLKDLNINKKLR